MCPIRSLVSTKLSLLEWFSLVGQAIVVFLLSLSFTSDLVHTATRLIIFLLQVISFKSDPCVIRFSN